MMHRYIRHLTFRVSTAWLANERGVVFLPHPAVSSTCRHCMMRKEPDPRLIRGTSDAQMASQMPHVAGYDAPLHAAFDFPCEHRLARE